MPSEKPRREDIVKPVIFSNWGDNFGYPLAFFFLPYVSKIKFLTPNVISIISFTVYTIGCFSLFIEYPNHLIVSAIFLPLGFVGDDLDGQIARFRKLSSKIGDFLDKVLDVLKMFLVTCSLGIATYMRTDNVIYPFLAFVACFFFMYRYYIKLETMFSKLETDPQFLEKSSTLRKKLIEEFEQKIKNAKTLKDKLYISWHNHRIIAFVDEAEFAIFVGIAALFNKLEWVLILLAVSQVIIAIYRLFERGSQLNSASDKLLLPMRK